MLFKGKKSKAFEQSYTHDPDLDYSLFSEIWKSRYIKTAMAVFSVSVLIALISALSTPFAEWYSRSIGGAVLKIMACITAPFPFSLAETLLFVGAAGLIYCISRQIYSSVKKVSGRRFFEIKYNKLLVGVLLTAFSIYNLGFAPCNNRNTLAENLGLEVEKITPQQIYNTALICNSEIAECVEKGIRYDASHSSQNPYSYGEMNEIFNSLYADFCYSTGFLADIDVPVKRFALSRFITYTQIAGIYIPYTGEANINTNYPDYVVAFSQAHEMAHQRGISREDEANFMAFLLLYESGDNYLKYACLMELYDYLTTALWEADTELYVDLMRKTNINVVKEQLAYYNFFADYRNDTISGISGAVNDAAIKLRGHSEGAKSYNMMVDLAVAYFENVS